ncbi:MAG: methylcrotonoyl-CoA carboxylase, partial [Vulcanimicrobiaceae bacterium]
MAELETRLDRGGDDYRRNLERMEALVAELRESLSAVRAGGGAEATAKHRKRGKLTARERVDRLVDAGSDFLEFSALAANDMYH